MAEGTPKQQLVIPASRAALNTSNPLRKLVDRLKPPVSDKTLISLSIGDPTVFGNLKTDEFINNLLVESLRSFRFNGYLHASGLPAARKAIAEAHVTPNDENLNEEDVIITSGCSGALEIAMVALANEGDNILIPKPGFSFYQTVTDSKGFEARYYSLLPDKNWEVDLAEMESLINEKTRAILINNPSNPCGSVYNKEHLLELLKIAERHQVPIIADEIYEHMTFSGHTFHSLASLSTTVPIIAVGGLAKRYLVPGWRLGWIILHDRNGLLPQIRAGCHSLATLILGANSLVQSIVPAVLKDTPKEFYDRTQATLEEQAIHFAKRVAAIPGLKPIQPQGAMYLMVQIDISKFEDLPSDVEFSERLVKEELVVVLPGSIFKCPNFFRVVICAPKAVLDEACDRIQEFCARHAKRS